MSINIVLHPLAAFSEAARGIARSIAPRISSEADFQWARDFIAAMPHMLKAKAERPGQPDPGTQRAEFPQPSPEQLFALKEFCAQTLQEAETRTAKKLFDPILAAQGIARVETDTGTHDIELSPHLELIVKPRSIVKKFLADKDKLYQNFDWFSFGNTGVKKLHHSAKSSFGVDFDNHDALNLHGASDGFLAAIEAATTVHALWKGKSFRRFPAACAYEASRIIHGGQPDLLLASRMALALPDALANNSLRDLYKPVPPALISTAEQTPEAIMVANAFAAIIGIALSERGQSLAGDVRATLRSKFGLSNGGWKACLECARSAPNFFRNLSTSPNYQTQTSANWYVSALKTPGYLAPLADGTTPTPPHAELLGFCSLANICSDISFPLADAARFLDHESIESAELASPVPNTGGPFLHILNTAPILWRQTVENSFMRMDPNPRVRNSVPEQESVEFEAAWDQALELIGIPGTTILDATATAALDAKGWIPKGRLEQSLHALDQDRIARGEKSKSVISSLLTRAKALGIESLDLDREANQVRDMLCDVELGFWSQAPAKISWPWLMGRARDWHLLVQDKKASENAWQPIVAGPIELGEGWTARELCDGGSLFAEGRAQSHCVSGYAGVCAKGLSRIFALSDAHGQSRSTIEMKCHHGPGEDPLGPDGKPSIPSNVEIVQHRGFANSIPALKNKILAQNLLRSIQSACAQKHNTAPSAS